MTLVSHFFNFEQCAVLFLIVIVISKETSNWSETKSQTKHSSKIDLFSQVE